MITTCRQVVHTYFFGLTIFIYNVRGPVKLTVSDETCFIVGSDDALEEKEMYIYLKEGLNPAYEYYTGDVLVESGQISKKCLTALKNMGIY